jgi:hypothetical protein
MKQKDKSYSSLKVQMYNHCIFPGDLQITKPGNRFHTKVNNFQIDGTFDRMNGK